MTSFSFTKYGTPVPKQRARSGNGHHFTPKETMQYEREINLLARATRPADWRKRGTYHLTVIAYFADRRRRDIDNVLKSVADALNGVAYDDDNMVTRISAEKCTGEPRTEVTVQWLGEEPVKARKRKVKP